MSDCLFCNIANKTIDTQLLLDDEHIVAFHDINPKAPTHILIIPKVHLSTLNDCNPEHKQLLGHMMLSAQQLAVQYNIAQSGYRVVMNINNDGGQEVYHIHLHLLGGKPLSWFQ